MSIFPNALSPAVYSQQLAPDPNHHSLSFLERHPHPATEILHSILSHVFSPSVYHNPTASSLSPRTIRLEENTVDTRRVLEKAGVGKKGYRVIVDDDFVFLEECREDEGGEDGGPICREAEIQRWNIEGGRR